MTTTLRKADTFLDAAAFLDGPDQPSKTRAASFLDADAFLDEPDAPIDTGDRSADTPTPSMGEVEPQIEAFPDPAVLGLQQARQEPPAAAPIDTPPAAAPLAQAQPEEPPAGYQPWEEAPVPSYDEPVERNELAKGVSAGVEGVKGMGVALGVVPQVGAIKHHLGQLAVYDAIDKGEEPPATDSFTANRARMYAAATPDKRGELRARAEAQMASSQELKAELATAWKGFSEEMKKSAGRVPNFTDIRDLKDFSDYFAYQSGQALPYFAVSILGGLLAGIPGVVASGYAMGVGDIEGEMIEKGVEMEGTGAALVGGVPYAALDMLGPVGRVFRGVPAATLKQAAQSWAKRGGKELGENLVEEFINEAGQEFVKDMTVAGITGDDVFTPENFWKWFNAGMAGVVGSSVPGAARAVQVASEPAPVVSTPSSTLDYNGFQPVGPSGGDPTGERPEGGGSPPAAGEPAGSVSSDQRAEENAQPAPRSVPEIEEDLDMFRSALAEPEVSDTERKILERAIAEAEEERAVAAGEGTRESPVVAETEADIRRAEDAVAEEPTDAQKLAGVYPKGHLKVQGLPITIENAKGDIREGKAPDGTEWSVEMPEAYGYIKRTTGTDKEQVDVYLGPEPMMPEVYVVNQLNPETGKLDEHKVMIGFGSLDEARATYDAGFSDGSGPSRRHSIAEMPMEEFKAWLKDPKSAKRLARSFEGERPGFSLAQELAARGGIADGGDLGDLGKRRINIAGVQVRMKGTNASRMARGLSPVARQNGMNWDEAAKIAHGLGFIDSPDNIDGPDGVKALLAKDLEAHNQGDRGRLSRVYSREDEGARRYIENEQAKAEGQRSADQERGRLEYGAGLLGIDPKKHPTNRDLERAIEAREKEIEEAEHAAKVAITAIQEELPDEIDGDEIPFGALDAARAEAPPAPSEAERQAVPGLPEEIDPGDREERGALPKDGDKDVKPVTTEQTDQGTQVVVPGAERDGGASKARETGARAKAEMEAKAKQTKLGRTNQASVKDQDGGLFSAERDQKSMLMVQPPFYSALEKSLSKLPEKGTGPQMLATLKNTQGVKEGEIVAIGLDTWLPQQEKVTRKEIEAFVAANKVEIVEVTHGRAMDEIVPDAKAQADHQAEWDRLLEVHRQAEETANAGIDTMPDGYRLERGRVLAPNDQFVGHAKDSDDASYLAWKDVATQTNRELDKLHLRMVDETAKRQGLSGKPTKFSGYVLPGGENYREVLLTLPKRGADVKLPAGSRLVEDQDQDGGETKSWTLYGPDGANLMEEIFAPTEAAARAEAERRYQRYVDENDRPRDTENYRGGHFDEPNVLAHVRLNDRTDADGKRVLFVEEIQSDWHQKGRREGYDAPSYRVRNLDSGNSSQPFATKAEAEEYLNGMPAGLRPRLRVESGKKSGAVPDAPFKKDWHELAFRRVLKMAADEGYDRVAWTTGKQQVDRYEESLRDAVDRVEWTKTKDGIHLVGFKGTRKVVDTTEKESALSDAVGKSMGDKIIADPNQSGVLEGKDLTISDTGMAGFYDRILVSYANKFAKQYGSRVGEASVNSPTDGARYSGPIPDYSDLNEMRRAVNQHGPDIFVSPYDNSRHEFAVNRVANSSALRAVEARMKNGESFADAMAIDGNQSLAALFGGEITQVKQPGSNKVHSIDVTPQMREALQTKGVPMFKEDGTSEDLGDDEITPEFRDRAAEVKGQLEIIAKRLFPGLRIEVTEHPTVEMTESGPAAPLGAYYVEGLARIAGVALRDKRGIRRTPKQIVWALHHEGLHYLIEMGVIGPRDMLVLERAVKAQGWRSRFNIESRYRGRPEEVKIEEAISDAFGAYSVGALYPSSGIRVIFDRIARLMESFGNWLRGNGFRSYRDVFRDVAAGKLLKKLPPTMRQIIAANQRRLESQLNQMTPKPASFGQALNAAQRSMDQGRQFRRGMIPTGDLEGMATGPDRLAPDLGMWTSIFIDPRMIASLKEEFTPVYMTAEKQQQIRDGLVFKYRNIAQRYFELSPEKRKKVDAALELGALQFEVYGGDNIRMTNRGEHDAGHAALSKPGDVIHLDQEQSRAYVSARRMYDTALDDFKDQVLRENGFDPSDPKQPKTSKELLKRALAATKYGNLDQAAQYRFAAKLVEEIEDAKSWGYVPFSRYGNVAIIVQRKVPTVGIGMDGKKAFDWETIERRHFDVTGVMDKLKEKIGRAQPFRDIPEIKAAMAELEAKYKDDPNVRIGDPHLMAPRNLETDIKLGDIDVLAEAAKIDDNQWEPIREKIAHAIKSRTFKSHFFKRRQIAGYSTDFERSGADYIIGMSNYMARRQTREEWDRALGDIPATQEKLRKYAKDYHDYFQNPVEEMATLRQLSFLWAIGPRISAMLVNATQPIVTSIPHLSKFVGAATAAKEQARASIQALGMLRADRRQLQEGNPFDFAKAPPDVRAELLEMERDGQFLPVYTHEMLAIAHNRSKRGSAEGLGKPGSALSKVTSPKTGREAVQWLGAPFGLVERINRVTTAIAAIRIAKKVGRDKVMKIVANDPLAVAKMKDFSPLSFAEWSVDETQFRLGKVNRARVGRGAGSPFMILRGFNVNMFERLYKLGKLYGREGKAEILLIMLALAMFSGFQGLPGVEDLEDILDWTLKRITGEDHDTRRMVREGFYKLTGSAKVAEAMYAGVTRFFGADTMHRVGLGTVPGINMLVHLLTSKDFSVPASDLSAPLGMFIGAIKEAAQKSDEDKPLSALGAAMPYFLKDLIVANEWADAYTGGVRNARTGITNIPAGALSNWDKVLRATGFTPSVVANAREAEYAASREKQGVAALQSEYRQKLARAIVAEERADENKDAAAKDRFAKAQERLWKQIDAHNKEADDSRRIIINVDTAAFQTLLNQERGGYGARDATAPSKTRDELSRIREIYGIAR